MYMKSQIIVYVLNMIHTLCKMSDTEECPYWFERVCLISVEDQYPLVRCISGLRLHPNQDLFHCVCFVLQARLWVQIMKELRRGVRLKGVEHITITPTEYELTPFEILLDDIRSRRYTLNKVMVTHLFSVCLVCFEALQSPRLVSMTAWL